MASDKNRRSETKSLWTPTRVALTLLTLSLIAMLGVSSCNSTDESSTPNTPSSAKPAAPNPPRTAPPPPAALTALPRNVLDTTLKSANGTPIKLSNYSGKVLVVNLWATWCGPCRLEIPELVKLHKEYRDQGVEVVGLSTENPVSSEEGVKEFVKDYKVSYAVGWAPAEVAITLMQGRDAIPQSFVISRDGRILKRFIGFNISTTPPQIKQAIEDALKT